MLMIGKESLVCAQDVIVGVVCGLVLIASVRIAVDSHAHASLHALVKQLGVSLVRRGSPYLILCLARRVWVGLGCSLLGASTR